MYINLSLRLIKIYLYNTRKHVIISLRFVRICHNVYYLAETLTFGK